MVIDLLIQETIVKRRKQDRAGYEVCQKFPVRIWKYENYDTIFAPVLTTSLIKKG